MNDKTSIYSESYKVEPKDKSKVIAELRGTSAAVQRTQKLGILLKEEKTANKTLTINLQLLEKKHTLLNGKTRKLEAMLAEEQKKSRRLRRENEALHIENRRLGVRV